MPLKHVTLDDGREMESSERFELGRNFCNKIWNAARFALMHIKDCERPNAEAINSATLALPHRWILSRASKTTGEVIRSLEDYRFNDAGCIRRGRVAVDPPLGVNWIGD